MAFAAAKMATVPRLSQTKIELFSTHYKYSYTHAKKTRSSPLGTSPFAPFHARYGSE
jgi:hypothetical protein